MSETKEYSRHDKFEVSPDGFILTPQHPYFGQSVHIWWNEMTRSPAFPDNPGDMPSKEIIPGKLDSSGFHSIPSRPVEKKCDACQVPIAKHGTSCGWQNARCEVDGDWRITTIDHPYKGKFFSDWLTSVTDERFGIKSPTPSKEGASQSLPDGYGIVYDKVFIPCKQAEGEDYPSSVCDFDDDEQRWEPGNCFVKKVPVPVAVIPAKYYEALQSQLSSMKAERDQALKDLTEDARLWDVAQKDHELAIQEGQKWKDESNTLSALLEGKNLEIARVGDALNNLMARVENHYLPEIESYKLTIDMQHDEIGDYRKALKPGTAVMAQIEILDKYKKEEQK